MIMRIAIAIVLCIIAAIFIAAIAIAAMARADDNARTVATPKLAGVLAQDPIWKSYKSRFVTEAGRVIDTANGQISHSEGQGYGMLLAVAALDRNAFDRICGWTRANLMVRDDQLLGDDVGERGVGEPEIAAVVRDEEAEIGAEVERPAADGQRVPDPLIFDKALSGSSCIDHDVGTEAASLKASLWVRLPKLL